MADEDEALLAAEVAADQLAPPDVEVVGRLVDEQKAVVPREEQRQQQLGLLASGERVEAPPQHLPVQAQRRRLPLEPPARHVGAELVGELAGEPLRVRRGEGKVIESQGRVDPPLEGIFSHQQLQKGRLAAAVAADKAQLPVAVDLKARMFEYVVVAARIGKAEVRYPDQRHVAASLKNVMSRRKTRGSSGRQTHAAPEESNERFPAYPQVRRSSRSPQSRVRHTPSISRKFSLVRPP